MATHSRVTDYIDALANGTGSEQNSYSDIRAAAGLRPLPYIIDINRIRLTSNKQQKRDLGRRRVPPEFRKSLAIREDWKSVVHTFGLPKDTLSFTYKRPHDDTRPVKFTILRAVGTGDIGSAADWTFTSVLHEEGPTGTKGTREKYTCNLTEHELFSASQTEGAWTMYVVEADLGHTAKYRSDMSICIRLRETILHFAEGSLQVVGKDPYPAEALAGTAGTPSLGSCAAGVVGLDDQPSGSLTFVLPPGNAQLASGSPPSAQDAFDLQPNMFFIHHLALCRWIPEQSADTRAKDHEPYRTGQQKLDKRQTYLPGGPVWHWISRAHLSLICLDLFGATNPISDWDEKNGDEVQPTWIKEENSLRHSWDLGQPKSIPQDMYVAAHRHSQWIDFHCDFYAPAGKYKLEIRMNTPERETWASRWNIPEILHSSIHDLTGVQWLYGQATDYESWHPTQGGKQKWLISLGRGKVDTSKGDIYPISPADSVGMTEVTRDSVGNERLNEFHIIRPPSPLEVGEGVLQRMSMFVGTNEDQGGAQGILRAPFIFGGVRLLPVEVRDQD